MKRSHPKKPTLLVLLILITSAPGARGEDNWPQFRGPGSRGLPAVGAKLPAEWSAEKNVAWKAEVPGLGWSSPVVWGGKVFITSAVSVAGEEKPQMGLYLGKSRGEGEQRFLVLCYDLSTGKQLWEREVHRGVPAHKIHLKNSFASATSVTDGKCVVSLFHDVGLFAFDLDGNPLWKVPVKATKTRASFGHGGSPVLHDGRVYLVDDNDDDAFAAAFDALTGKELWRVKRERETNYATPFIWTAPTPAQFVVPATKRTIAYDLDGKEVWSFTGGMSKLTICTPFTAHGLLFVGSGYFQDPVRGMFAIKPTAHGDITLRDGATSSDAIAWFNPRIAPYNTTPLVFGDELYILYDQGMLSCYDAKTGKPHYERTRLGAGGFTASPWANDGKVFCLSERAETFAVKAGPQFELLGRNALEAEPCLATPALVGDSVVLRTASRLYRIRAAAGADAKPALKPEAATKPAVATTRPADATALANKIVASHGGADKLLRTFTFDETYVLANGKPTNRKSLIQPPNLWYVGKTERVSEQNKGGICHDVWMWTLGPLVDPKTKLEALPDTAVEGKAARGLKVSGSIEPPMNVFFDAATDDLIKIEWKGEQFLFSAPMDVDGTRIPSKCILIGKTGKERMRTELKKVERLAALPADLPPPKGK